MSDPKRTVPLYESRRRTVAGVEAVVKPGDDATAQNVTWDVRASSLGGVTPRAGDRCRGTDGIWWTVKNVGALADGSYPLLCEREEGGGE